MNTKLLVSAAAAVVAVALAIALSGGMSDAERAVRETLARAVDAVELGDEGALQELIAADYKDRLGHTDATIVRRVMAEVKHYDALRIELGDLDVKVDEGTGHATAMFKPGFDGTRTDSPSVRDKYQGADGRRLVVTFRRHGPDWLITRGDMGFSFSDHL